MALTPANFKKSLTALLQSYIDDTKPLVMEWQCSFCNNRHTGNLFKKVTAIENNIVSGDMKAEIGLMTADGQLFAAIHVSKNKKPTEAAINYYRTQAIIYIQVVPDEDVLLSVQKPFYVGTCLNPKCKTCGSFQYDKSLVIIDSKCWKCHGDMKVAVLYCEYSVLGPDKFTSEELTIAREKGAIIQTNYSSVVREEYLSNTCPHCQKLTGNYYLFEHLSDAKYGYSKYESIPAGYFCGLCHWDN